MKPLVIIGGGGFCREVMWLAQEAVEPWEVVGVLDDSDHAQGTSILGVPVLGRVEDWRRHEDKHFVIAVGSPRVRKAVHSRMSGDPRFATLVHRTVLSSRYVDIGPGSIICAGTILTTQVKIGSQVIINLGVTVGHDVILGDYCTLAPHATISGAVSMGDGVEIGTGAALIQGLSIGKGSMVAAGALVAKDIAENAFAAGSPARTIKQLDPF